MLSSVKAKEVEIDHEVGVTIMVDSSFQPGAQAKSEVETLVLELVNRYDRDVQLVESMTPLVPVIRACTNLKRIKVKPIDGISEENAEQLLKLFREAAPNAEVEYVRAS
jgi:hypothetical protein